MRHIILGLFFILSGFVTFGQSDSCTQCDFDISFGCIETPPRFAGGHVRMQKLLVRNMRYPKEAEKLGVDGVVKVSFAVDTFGSVTNMEIITGIREDLDQEALRLLGLLKHWISGTINDRKIMYYLVQPFKFTLNKRATLKYNSKTKTSR